MLRYNHWRLRSRQTDTDETRTVITLTLTTEGDAETVLEVHQENLTSDETLGHARFFWRNALNDVKDIVESARSSS